MPPYSTAHDLAMDFEGAHPNVQIGVIDPGDATNDNNFAGSHLSIITAASVGQPTWPDGTKLARLRLLLNDTNNPSQAQGRFLVEVYGKDALETDFEVGGAQQHMSWIYDGQDYWNVFGICQPSNFGWDAGNQRPNLIVKSDLWHQDSWVAGVVQVNGAGGNILHGGNAHGILLAYNKSGVAQQFTPRPGDGFQPALTDTRPYWAFVGDHGDVTNTDNVFTWALRQIVPDVMMFFIVRYKKRDYSFGTSGAARTDQHGVVDSDPGIYQVWAYTRAELDTLGLSGALAAAPIIDYSGTTNSWGTTADATAFDPASPDASEPGGPRWPLANQTPRYTRKRPRYTYAAQLYYTNPALVNLPSTAGIYHTGMRRFQTRADAMGALFSGATGSAPTNTAVPTISGTLETGFQLAGANGTWTGSPTFTYQWEVDTAPGSGSFVAVAAHGTGQKYIVPQSLLGHSVRLAVTGTNAFGSFTARSAPTAALTKGALDPGVRDAENPISQDGNWAAVPIQVGQNLLRLTAAGIQSDGVSGHSCQGYRTDVDSQDTGIRATVAAIGAANYAFTFWLAVQNPNTGTAKAYLCSFVQGTGYRIFRYRAAIDGFVDITGGAPVTTNVPAVNDIIQGERAGTTIRIKRSTDGGATFTTILTATDALITGHGTIGFEIADVGPTAAFKLFDQVVVNSPPSITTAPVISGTAPLGDGVLTVSDGVWANSPVPPFGYQWTRDGVDITGATSNSYVKDPADVGHAVGCNVTATNANGSTLQAASNTVTVTQNAPTNLTLPSILGDPSSSRPLTVDRGTWSDSPTSYTQQWRRRLPGGTAADIATATGQTYIPTDSDIGYLITVVVTATNAGGTSDPASAVEVGPIAARVISRRFIWDAGAAAWR